MNRKVFSIICLLALVVSALSSQNARGSAKSASPLIVAAAADLVVAFKEIKPLFESSSGIELQLIFSSSGTAREQIENGAPYDVYASANVAFVDYLIDKGRILADSKELYAIGRVGIATLKSNTLTVTNPEDLRKKDYKKIAIADPSHAPYGLAAKEALISLNLWDSLQDRMVYGKDIQHTLTLLRSGNVEAAFIALSVYDASQTRFLLLDDVLHKPLRQAIAVVKGTKKEADARAFIRFVNGPQGRAVMKKYGFVLPEEGR